MELMIGVLVTSLLAMEDCPKRLYDFAKRKKIKTTVENDSSLPFHI